MTERDSTFKCVYMVLVCLAVGVTVGCTKKADSSAAPPGNSAATVATASQGDAAQKFLAELEAQPAEKRKSFVEVHQSEASLVASHSDPKVTEKFYNLMMPKMAMPKAP